MKNRSVAIGILMVLALAAVLRTWGIDFGLPYALDARPDERQLIHTTVRFFEGNFHPRGFHYPSLFYYMLFVCYVGFAALARLTGAMASMYDMPFVFVSGSEGLHVTARLLSASFGVATVYVVWRVGLRCLGRRTGFFAALFLAVAYLHGRDCHFGVTDAALTFFVALGHLPILWILRGGGPRAYVAAGLVMGLGASVKYNAAVLVVPLLAAHLLQSRRTGWSANWRRLALAAAIAGVAFVCTSPYSVIDARTFFADLRYELFVHANGGHAIDVGLGWRQHLALTLRYGLGLPLCLCAASGMVWLAVRQGRLAAVLLALPIAYYLVIGPRHTVFVRYALPLLPSLAVCAGYFCSCTLERCRHVGPLARALCVATLLAALAPTTIRLIQFDDFLCREDTRCTAARWLQARLSPGDRVGWVGEKYTLATPPAEFEARKRVDKVVDFIDTPEQLRARWPTFMATCGHGALGHFCRVPPGIGELLRTHYRLETVIDPEGAETHRDAYDRQDAFFVPYAGFRGARRPGPKVAIYRRRS